MKKVFVYAIVSIDREYIYVAQTDNLSRRIDQHNSGKSRATKPYAPFKLIFTEEHATRTEARIREKFLKSCFGRRRLKTLKYFSCSTCLGSYVGHARMAESVDLPADALGHSFGRRARWSQTSSYEKSF